MAQDPADVFEKAPPDVDGALRARVTQFYQYFVDGKFRLADALVAEDAKDTFFAAEKRRYHACAIGNVTYSENFTKAKVVTSCDTEYFFGGNRIPVKLPIVSTWKVQDGEWFWYVAPAADQSKYNSPVGPVLKPPSDQPDTSSKPAVTMPDPASILEKVKHGVRVDRSELDFDGSKASKQEIHLKNTLPGRAAVTSEFSIPGISVTPNRAELAGDQEVTVVIAFDPKDPKIVCQECLAHPQTRSAGTVVLRVDPTGQELPIQVVIATPEK
jgi:hypothetical protein